jgi:nucleoid DNA-binding protein/cell division septation protein DedD
MIMDKHIKEYLLQHEKIQVNNLGVFKIVYKSAEIHPILHTFTIPGRYVVFSENSIADTNKLAIFITSKENISIDIANQRILEWVNMIKQTIASKKEYSLSSLGKFFINAMGKIEFTPLLDIDISPESFGLEEFTIPFSSETKIRKKENGNTDQKEIEKPTLTEKIENKQQDAVHVNEETQETTGTVNENIELPDNEDNEENEEDLLEEPIDGFDDKHRLRRKPGHTLLLVILFLLLCTSIGIGITYFLYPETVETYAEQLHLITCPQKEDTKQVVVSESEQKKETETVKTKSTKEEFLPSGGQAEENTTTATSSVEEKQNIIPAGNYYIVLGSFQSIENAQTFLKNLQEEYSNAVDLGKGQTSGLYLIAIGPYTKIEAENQIRNGVKGWILKK